MTTHATPATPRPPRALTPASLRLRQALRQRRLRRADLEAALEISGPTATKYLADPLHLDGHQRRRLARLLGVSASQVDALLRADN